MEEVKAEAECKNCKHPVTAHKPRCSITVYDRIKGRICDCKTPQHYGILLSDNRLGWTEFRCNNCGCRIGYLNSIDENIYKILEKETIVCSDCL
jgi:hypothetical protein